MTVSAGNILFICTGNICRSPFAEGLLNKLVAEKGLAGIKGDSAGIFALPGNAATAMAQRVASEHGVDMTSHGAKLCSDTLLSWCDLALVMEKSHQDDLLASFSEATGKVYLLRHFAINGSRKRGIADPYGLQYEAYRFCYLDIHEAITGLLASLSNSGTTFVPVDVCCYEGYRANESPRSFEWKGRTCLIAKIVDRWYEGKQEATSVPIDYFKVEIEDGSIFILRYDSNRDSWGGKVL